MPASTDEKLPIRPPTTSEEIQKIFAEVQSQLPSVNFDNDDLNDNDENVEILEPNIPDNTNALLNSLLNDDLNSFMTLHPKIETPQQPPSVEQQMRTSPTLFDNASQNQESSSKPSFLSMDLFNSIDFDKLPSFSSSPNVAQYSNLTRTFHRPSPINHQTLSSRQQINVKNRDDRHILERLAQHANKFNSSSNERSQITRENHPFRNLETALYETSYQDFDRHGRRIEINQSQRKTVHIDLRNSSIKKQEEEPQYDQTLSSTPKLTEDRVPSSESDDDEDDDDGDNDGLLWFEKRQLARQQHHFNSSNQ